MPRTALLGLPRIGPERELKLALESHWAGDASAEELLAAAASVREHNWQRAREAGIDLVPCGDFSLYDHVLDTAWGLGAIPERFGSPEADDLDAYFAMARGRGDVRPLEMTKWFDTNYHYLVPELEPGQRFDPRPDHWVGQLREARALGLQARPVVLGPLSFLLLSKGPVEPLGELPRLTEAYEELLRALEAEGAEEIQIDEPCLVLDQPEEAIAAFERAFSRLAGATGAQLALATYFEGLPAEALGRILACSAAEIHLDLVRAPEQLEPALVALREGSARLSVGVLDGRNVWAMDPDAVLEPVDAATAALGVERVTIAPSCSLLHVPYEAARETGLDPEVRGWLAFCAEKLDELRLLGEAADADAGRREGLLGPARRAAGERRSAARTNDPAVRERAAGLGPSDYERSAPAPQRREAQRARVELPELPTTTIGSYPQTEEIRRTRRAWREGRIDNAAYERFLEGQIDAVVGFQEELGLDVLVHGEPERADMVEYFGEQLAGFAFSEHGWVQSYGSRCVKPPILYGDVSRPGPMTVRWWRYAQSRTERPLKAVITGPVTIMQWSFVRDDQPRRDTCTQLALAMQDEVLDLERAGAFAIQIDEAALREGLPLHRDRQDEWVRWAVDCFRLAAAPAGEATQIHTHMCYSEFNDIIEHIVRLDADVLSIEASRSGMEVLDAFGGELEYPNDIGPGVYDIHSPRIPSVEEIERLLELAESRIGRDRLWVNPDCGLKTRTWEEVRPSLQSMVAAARRRRAASPVGRVVS